jgi:hypothetical protein
VQLYQQVFHILIQSGTMLALSTLNYNMMNSAWIIVFTNSMSKVQHFMDANNPLGSHPLVKSQRLN